VNAVDWYAARAAGGVAYALLTGGVLLGILLAGRARLPRWPAFAVTDVHRFVALLTGAFVGLHVYTLLLDRYVHTSLAAVLVPGASAYRPLRRGIVAAVAWRAGRRRLSPSPARAPRAPS
jgi:sulfoxide reductase heme-binding subunit YedZ